MELLDKNEKKPIVLLAEDDDGHALLLKKALKRHNFDNEIVRFTDGEKVVDYLSERASEVSHFLLLLDLNMPRLSGFELIEQLKKNMMFSSIPIIVLSSSSNPDDVIRAQQLGAVEYYVKPVNCRNLIRTIHQYCSQ